MSTERFQEVISVPDVADGNPATAIALSVHARIETGEQVPILNLPFTSWLVNHFHHGISHDPEKARRYSHESEERRVGLAARAYSMMSFAEFAYEVAHLGEREPTRWSVVQEHPLLGARKPTLQRLGIEAVRLFVPDVYPKRSGIRAVQRHSEASFSVWNTDAYLELVDSGLPVVLTRPYFLDVFRPDNVSFRAGGREVVVKSSGSGLPVEWETVLQTELGKSSYDWRMHTPKSSPPRQVQWHRGPATRIERLRYYFGDLGAKTRLFIGYPSEQVGVIAEMRERGVPVWMLTLPPRGAHEKRNLEFAMRHGLVHGELAFSDAHRPSLPELRQILPKMLPTILGELDQPELQSDLLGSKPVWSTEH